MRLRLAVALGICLFAGSSALASTLNVVGGGLTAPNANYGCPTGSANCLASLDYQLAAAANAQGTITVTGSTAHISFQIASMHFSPSSPGPSDIFFGTVQYTADVSVFATSTVVSQIAPGAGTVTGEIDGTPFSTPSAVYNLTCALTLGTSQGQCGVAFGPPGFTAGGRDWLHTFSVIVAPEPGVIALALLGFAGLALRRRSAS